MISGRSSNTGSDKQSYRIESDDSDSESEILEESPCGRWLKRKEEVSTILVNSFYRLSPRKKQWNSGPKNSPASGLKRFQ
jgi:hypothetical protein